MGDVEQLSQERLSTILHVRKWHVLGQYAAEMFDGVRGVDQGQERITKLFETKTCAQVLQSVDKSNPYVNSFCWLVSIIAGVGGLSFMNNVFVGSEHDRAGHAHAD